MLYFFAAPDGLCLHALLARPEGPLPYMRPSAHARGPLELTAFNQIKLYLTSSLWSCFISDCIWRLRRRSVIPIYPLLAGPSVGAARFALSCVTRVWTVAQPQVGDGCV